MKGVERISREWNIAREAAYHFRRDPKYRSGVLGMYALSFASPELGEVARSSYFFMRYIDDILDGDRIGVHQPLDRVLSLRSQVETGDFDPHDSKSRLVKGAIEILDRRSRTEDNPRQDFIDGINAMVFDHDRAMSRDELTRQELANYYDSAFSPVINLMLIGLKSRFRASYFPELSSTQGRLYSIRDLSVDWCRGVVNIPLEVLREACLSSVSSIEQVSNSSIVNDWIYEELKECKADLEDIDGKISELKNERVTKLMVRGLINPMKKFVERYD